MAVGIWLPFSPVAESLDFVPIAGKFWPIVIAILFAYIVLTQFVKMWLLRRRWI